MNAIQDTGGASSLLASLNAARDATKATADEPQNRFLKLLVTQMKNQDPLNPLDNAQVTSQLAQISTVNGIEKLNTTLQAIMGGFTAGQSLQAASMIGRGVLVPGSTLQLAGGSGVFGVDLAQPADKVSVTIRDASGRAVHAMDLGPQPAGTLALGWDGMTDGGAQAVDGNYSVSVAATRGEQKVDAQTLAYGTVQSVAQGSQGVKLSVGTLGAVSLADIKQIL